MIPIRKMLVATDFSTPSDHAVDAAVELAKATGASIDLVHAFDVPIPLVTPYEVAIPTNFITEAREAATRRLKECEEKIRAAGVEVRAHLSEIPAAPALAQAAKDLGSDLIVMGTRGNTGLKHILLGSVAERTLRTAPCSVLTVKDPA
jgi:universal stress protein A